MKEFCVVLSGVRQYSAKVFVQAVDEDQALQKSIVLLDRLVWKDPEGKEWQGPVYDVVPMDVVELTFEERCALAEEGK